MFLAALAASTLSLICNFFMTNYHLTDNHNAIEAKKMVMRDEKETDPDLLAAQAREKEARIVGGEGI